MVKNYLHKEQNMCIRIIFKWWIWELFIILVKPYPPYTSLLTILSTKTIYHSFQISPSSIEGAKRLVSKKNVFNILSLISDSISSVFYKCLVKILLEDNYCYVLLSDKMCWELSELLTILLLYYRCYKQIY